MTPRSLRSSGRTKDASAGHGRAPRFYSSTTSAPSPGPSASRRWATSLKGQDRFAIVASNGGSPAHPDWYYNLKAHPRITVEVGSQTFTVLAEELGHATRAELWPKLVAETPALGEFQAKTTRQIPVVMLTRQD